MGSLAVSNVLIELWEPVRAVFGIKSRAKVPMSTKAGPVYATDWVFEWREGALGANDASSVLERIILNHFSLGSKK